MKLLSLFLLAVSFGFSSDFTTGQAARALIGQTDFTSQIPGASDSLVGGVGGLAYANGMLIVADSNRIGAAPENNRVLLFQSLAATLPAPTDVLFETTICPICAGNATLVLGQPDFTSTNIALTAQGMRTPTAVATDGKVVAVSDTDNNRVLIWKSIPTTSGQAADIVVGQPNFTSSSIPGNTPTASSLRGPQGVWIQNGRLFVADTQYNRVLIWNSIPTKNNQPADLVLGQQNLTSAVQPDITQATITTDAKSLLNPVSVTSDGQRLYVADLGNNRVLIWNSIPTANQQPADVEIGQPDMTSTIANNTYNGGLCPSSTNGTAASITAATNAPPVVFTTTNHGLNGGQTIVISGATGSWTPVNGTFAVTVIDANTFSIAVDSTKFGTLSGTLTFLAYPARCAATLNFPRFALSDGRRLFVADGGNDRVLIYNAIPTTNAARADVILGQPTDQDNGLTDSNNAYDPGDLIKRANSDTIRTPMSLAWDGINLYVSDPFDRRVMVFTPGDVPLPLGVRNSASIDVFAVGSVTLDGTITANDTVTVTIGGTDYKYTITATDTLQTITNAITQIINNANGGSGDPNVLATAETNLTNGVPLTDAITAATNASPVVFTSTSHGLNSGQAITISGATNTWTPVNGTFIVTVIDANTFSIPVNSTTYGTLSGTLYLVAYQSTNEVLLTSRVPGTAGNNITLATTLSDNATIVATASGATLSHGGNAQAIAPGTIVSIFGDNLSDQTASAPNTADLPTDLGGVQVYFNGIRAPLTLVSPTQINAQVPFEILSSTSINCYVRIQRANGRIDVSNAAGVPIVAQNPGVYAVQGDSYPRPGIVVHGSSYATGTVSVDGSITAGDVATITIEDRSYTYTVQSGDTLDTVRDALIALLSSDPKVTAFAAGPFDRIRLRARVAGPAGNGIVFGASVNGPAGGDVILSPTNTALCCANVAGAPVTSGNPAVPGETIVVYATGMGLVRPDDARNAIVTGGRYLGPPLNTVTASVDSLAGGKTANVLFAGLRQGYVGLYEVQLELNSSLPTDPNTQLTIAQDIFVSNIITLPVVNPNPSTQ